MPFKTLLYNMKTKTINIHYTQHWKTFILSKFHNSHNDLQRSTQLVTIFQQQRLKTKIVHATFLNIGEQCWIYKFLIHLDNSDLRMKMIVFRNIYIYCIYIWNLTFSELLYTLHLGTWSSRAHWSKGSLTIVQIYSCVVVDSYK